MSETKKRILWPVLLLTALSLCTFVLAKVRPRRAPNRSATHSVNAQNPVTPQVARTVGHLRRGQLSPRLRWNLNALGDRLEKPGKERVTLTGTLTRQGDSQPVPITAVLQFPDRLLLTMQLGVQTRVVTFDGNAVHSSGGPPDSRELNMIESVVYDTAEHFFAEQTHGTGMTTRFLGDHFRVDDGTELSYVGPYYDVYQTTERIKNSVLARDQTKLYWFNSNTQLLERVTYLLEQSSTSVEIRISGWQEILNQQIPSRIVRLEKNQPVLTLAFSSINVGSKLSDSTFAP
jgi:hypothetical protein